jgi:hypothetical protein
MAHLERSPLPIYRTTDSGVYLRPKPDRRSEARETEPTIPAALLNVTLRRGDDFRQWSIRQRDIGCDCRILSPTSVIVSGCRTVDAAVARKHAWELEIASARADGWA